MRAGKIAAMTTEPHGAAMADGTGEPQAPMARWCARACLNLAPSETLGPDGAASALAGRRGRAAAGWVSRCHALPAPHMYIYADP
eukprot:150884-Pyramimonas_sp.AAC.1